MSNKNVPAKDTKEDIIKFFDSANKKLVQPKENNNEQIQPINEINKKWDMNDKIIELFAKTIEKDQELKKKYAIALIIILIIQLIALMIVFILKGCNVLSYSDSTFNLFITGGIAEVFVLVRVIVKYLFKDNLTSALNIILRNNNPIKRYKGNFNKSKTSKK